MRATESDGVAATQSRIAQHIEPDTLTCADRPSPLVSGHVLFGPHPKARALLLWGIFDTFSRIRFDQLGFTRPPKQTTHRVEEVTCLVRRLSSPLAAGDNGRAVDPADQLRAGRLDHLLEDIFALAPRRRREPRPAGRFAVTPDQPGQRAGCRRTFCWPGVAGDRGLIFGIEF